MANERILIVDDAPLNLKLAAMILEKEGYRVHRARDADEAWIYLDTTRPDLILLDIQMPGMDGMEMVRRLKAEPATAGIAVVALTAHAMRGDDLKAYAAGFDGYITKPIDTPSFKLQVREFLDRNSRTA
jgi:CheY-like chemotaxis protein